MQYFIHYFNTTVPPKHSYVYFNNFLPHDLSCYRNKTFYTTHFGLPFNVCFSWHFIYEKLEQITTGSYVSLHLYMIMSLGNFYGIIHICVQSSQNQKHESNAKE